MPKASNQLPVEVPLRVGLCNPREQRFELLVLGRPDFMTYPSGSPARTTDGWLELRFQ